jgi:hypothetical protein
MFPCKKCGAMIGVVGQCVYRCTCPPPTPEEIAAMREEQKTIFENAQNGIGQIITIPSALNLAQKLQMSMACVEHVKAAMTAVPNVVDVNVEVSVSVRVSVPVEKRGELEPIFLVEQELMDKFPMVGFDFSVAMDYSESAITPLPEPGSPRLQSDPPESKLDVIA